MQPKIYNLEDHAIDIRKIDSHAYYVIEKLRQAGFIAYLVGGSVRDLLLGMRPKDFDISTSAKPEEIKALFKKSCILIGKRFRLAHLHFGRKTIEVATFRSGDVTDSNLIKTDNIWGTPQEDVQRRDFTINGLFYNPENQTIIDYVSGYDDAKKKLLRSIGESRLRFRQDPVRMIRLLKFKARFDFLIDKEAEEAVYECKDDILKSSQARIFEELLRMLESGHSHDFFRYLSDFGFLKLLLPNLYNHHFFDYLKEIDGISLKSFPETVDRALLLSCLIYSTLAANIQKIETEIHLGQIAEMTSKLINSIFSPFFQLSKKLKSVMISILTNQFRLTPKWRPLKTFKIPRDPSFELALHFLKLRAMLDPSIMPVYVKWHEALFNFRNLRQKHHGRH